MNFQPYPFEKLNRLFLHVKPNENLKQIALTIGEPQFETPEFIQNELKNSTHLLNKYPQIAGDEKVVKAQIDFFQNRFGILLKSSQIATTVGTREALFSFPQFLLFDVKEPVIAYPNPFYQIYEGAAIASRAKSILMPLLKENDFKPKIDETILKECDLIMLNSPSNPTGSVMSLDELCEWVKMSIKYNFVLANDECYSEIYTNNPPPSLLNACIKVGNLDFKNVLVFNSISKRSSAPSLRSGFVAGDENILKGYAKFRTYHGCSSPLPIQMAAAKAWGDEEHVEIAREKYRRNFKLAEEILHIKQSEGTFYIWLEVKNDEEFAKNLYEKKNVKVLPGSYLGRENIGHDRVRIALVLEEQDTKEALKRVSEFIKGI
ncbi:MAG: succinyldiaminopimelate transaminase [Campylobacteraceae bacterium]|jgi:aspartate/methionine/tyrosine aminotransferase|nr:succinyldiaminopimelate transaminase [Campylobacteraceae bacterium]